MQTITATINIFLYWLLHPCLCPTSNSEPRYLPTGLNTQSWRVAAFAHANPHPRKHRLHIAMGRASIYSYPSGKAP